MPEFSVTPKQGLTYVALPKYYQGGSATTVPYDLLDATDHPENVLVPRPRNKSLLARNFNTFWTDGLNERKNGVTRWLIHHDDIDVAEETNKYIDIMNGLMTDLGADVISVIVPIKDLTGTTTTGWRMANPKMEQNDIRRFTMRELMKLPETFDRAGAGLSEDKWLMVNTGLLLVDMTKPWVEKFSFEIRDWMIARPDGTFVPTGISEDWKFSCFCALEGLKVYATRKVHLTHWGAMAFVNYRAWGLWETDKGVLGEKADIQIQQDDSQSLPPAVADPPPVTPTPEGKLHIIWHKGLAPEPGSLVNIISVSDPGEPGYRDDPYGCQVAKRLHFEFHDVDQERPGMKCPTKEDAKKIVEFVRENRDLPLCVQCVDGRFRSQGIASALAVLDGQDDRVIRRRGTYNKLLYRLIREAGDNPAPPEPKVSIVVAAWQPDHMAAFYLCMKQQRHKNWELLAISDGQAPWLKRMALEQYIDPRFRFIETEEHKGHWGHPYRQLGIDSATGDFIGLQNNDNYLTPGFIEQLVFCMEDDRADIALCHMLHNYFGWGHIGISLDPMGIDLGCWIARAEIVKSVPFTGIMATSDQTYVQGLISTCGLNRVAIIKKPLFAHC